MQFRTILLGFKFLGAFIFKCSDHLAPCELQYKEVLLSPASPSPPLGARAQWGAGSPEAIVISMVVEHSVGLARPDILSEIVPGF